MAFSYPLNQTLSCSAANTLFVENFKYIFNLIDSASKKVDSNDSVTIELVTSLSKECFEIAKTKTDNENGSLLSEDKYTSLFVGEFSEEFIEILKLTQELWQFSDYLDSYSTVELWDTGIKEKDKIHFVKTLKLLHNKLLLLDLKIKKNREQ